MTDFLMWRDSWLLGIEEIDADHQEMVRLTNRLVELRVPVGESAAQAPVGEPSLEALKRRLEELIDKVRTHFDREERFLRAIGYPGYAEHRREHLMQMAEFTDLRRCLERDGSQCMDLQTLQSIKDWFFNHVIAEDRVYAEYFFADCGGRLPDENPFDPEADAETSAGQDTAEPGESPQ